MTSWLQPVAMLGNTVCLPAKISTQDIDCFVLYEVIALLLLYLCVDVCVCDLWGVWLNSSYGQWLMSRMNYQRRSDLLTEFYKAGSYNAFWDIHIVRTNKQDASWQLEGWSGHLATCFASIGTRAWVLSLQWKQPSTVTCVRSHSTEKVETVGPLELTGQPV